MRPPAPHSGAAPPPTPMLLAVRAEAADAMGPAAEAVEAVVSGEWTEMDTAVLLYRDLAAGDAALMTRWILKHRAAVLDPFLRVSLSPGLGSSGLSKFCRCLWVSCMHNRLPLPRRSAPPALAHSTVPRRVCTLSDCCFCSPTAYAGHGVASRFDQRNSM